jgi:2-polyprenyl-3-methyl-5-hydroxy-6-metoxy-1,4-benzoquinol methylase
MERDIQIQQNNYFEYRNISDKSYTKAILPFWIQKEIDNQSLNILDYGCGFGQNLIALKSLGFKNIFSVDIEKSAIDFCVGGGTKR